MSWLYSRALVEAFSEATCSAGARSALLSGSPTPQAFLPPDRTTAFSRLSRFGMTFGPLTDDLGADVLTWCLGASLARTSASPAKAPASTASDPACGATWRGSLAKFDPASSTWRTAQPSLLGDSEECSVTWPRSGMTAGGLCWELPMLGRRISGTGSGLWPTPVASDTSSRTKPYAQGGTPLSLAVKWPTPRACSAMAANITPAAIAKAAERFPNLETVVARRMFRTPNASDGRKWSNNTQAEREAQGRQVMLCHQLETGGALNPMWVEWLMGWPLGWTDLKPLVTGKYPPALPQPGEFSQAEVA